METLEKTYCEESQEPSIWIEKEDIFALQKNSKINVGETEISLEFLKKIGEKEYVISVDGTSYSIPVKQLLSVLLLSEKRFDFLCKNPKIDTLYNVPKDHFLYAAYCFFKEKKSFLDYEIPPVIFDRINDLKSLQKIDFEAFNQYLEYEKDILKTISLDKDFETTMLSELPEDLNDLEKAIYLYINMCKTLTYDDEYYAVNQEEVEKHMDPSYVSHITLKKNKVVCFEFNLMYAKLLSSLKVSFATTDPAFMGEAYGYGHINLEFRSGKFLVIADSVTSILDGDLVRAKLNQPLNGLVCMNKNQETQSQFKQMVNKVYARLKEKETWKQPLEIDQKSLNFYEKLSLFFKKGKDTNFIGIDFLSYLLQLRKEIFTKQEQTDNFAMTIIRDNQPQRDDQIATSSAIVTINDQNFEQYPEKNQYYVYRNQKLYSLTKQELQEKFHDQTFAYISFEDPKIPGLLETKKVKTLK